MKLLLVVGFLLAALFGGYYYFKQNYAVYYLDPYNTCIWENGHIISKTEAADRSTLKLVKKANEAALFHSAAETQTCVTPGKLFL